MISNINPNLSYAQVNEDVRYRSGIQAQGSNVKKPGDHRDKVESSVSKRIVRKSMFRTRETQAMVHTGLG